MQITVFSFLMAMLWSSIFVILLYVFRKRGVFIQLFGVSSMVILYVFCIIRIIFPFELPFTQVVTWGQVYNSFYDVFYFNDYTVGNITFKLKTVLILVWICVFAALLLCFIIRYHKYIKSFSRLRTDESGKAKDILEKVKAENKRKLTIDVIYTGQIDLPIGIGIVKKRILLPNNDYTNEQLYYILRHEYTHFLNRDLIVKMLVQVFCYIFWWNPFVYLLRKDIDQVLEIKCDLTVTERMDNSECADYLSTIVSVLKKDRKIENIKSPVSAVALFDRKKKSNLEERFEYVAKGGATKKKTVFSRMVALLVFCSVVLFSYSFVFQSQFEAPIGEIVTDPGTKEVDPDDMYITVDEEGNYFLVAPDGTTSPIEDFEQHREVFEQDGIKIIEEENEK